LEDGLIIFDSLTVVAGSSDNDVSTTREKSFDDLNSDRALADTSAQGILAFEGGPRCGNFMKNVKVDTGEVAAILPRGSNLAFKVEKRNLSGRDGSGTSILRTKELRRRAAVARLNTSTRIGTFMERTDNVLIQSLDTILLVLVNLRERLHDSPEFKNIVLHLLSVDRSSSTIATRHLFDVRLEFAYILSDNFGINNITLCGDFGMGSGGKSH